MPIVQIVRCVPHFLIRTLKWGKLFNDRAKITIICLFSMRSNDQIIGFSTFGGHPMKSIAITTVLRHFQKLTTFGYCLIPLIPS